VPTYSYRCTECDTAFDIHQAFTDSSLTECPTCGGKLRKVFSSIGVTFNGSGFYRNDSRSTSSSTEKAVGAAAPKVTAPATSGAKESASTGASTSAATSSAAS
jgi:putative FmdB family regulatory protein